ncbi:hypothetical protein F4779DRAFT_600078 [Xylariaceae sp. FL0662B]|nr:hypothetical protein F4779DRAFT_600078 [Xylariaceae sp. FL0662B]
MLSDDLRSTSRSRSVSTGQLKLSDYLEQCCRTRVIFMYRYFDLVRARGRVWTSYMAENGLMISHAEHELRRDLPRKIPATSDTSREENAIIIHPQISPSGWIKRWQGILLSVGLGILLAPFTSLGSWFL